ncbi:MAG: class A beta-lactamase-related serine hydrolase [Firmicutes bacterium]|nr:class A beta-lactamase-related serine hydrolase [Bacillota bacterium]
MLSKKFLFVLTLAVLLLTVNPTVDQPARKPASPLPDYGPLQKNIYVYLTEQPGIYGLYFIDLNSGQEFGYNAMTPFHAASTFKLPMNLHLYLEASRGILDLSESLLFKEKHLEGGTGVLKDEGPGFRYSISQLSGYSVIHSDNIATNILLEKLDRQKVKDFMRSLGARVVNNQSNITCPYDLALYMRRILEFSRSRAPGSNQLLNHLFNARYKDRIPAPLPAGARVANKIGSWPPEHTYNDAAYIVHPRRPYILVINSKETPGYGQTLPVMHNISLIVYEYQSSVRQEDGVNKAL